MSVLPGSQFTSDLDHYEDGAAALLEFRLVNVDGEEVIAWSSAAITQVTASEDGPDWRYRATRTAPATTGVYTRKWRLAADAPDGEVWTDTVPLVVSIFAAEIPDWAPIPDVVAAILRARTRGPASRDAQTAGEHDTFTEDTRPTYAQVQELIGLAAGDMLGLTGGRGPCTDSLTLSMSTATAYRAAMLCEVSYFPEQTTNDQSAFEALRKMWESSGASIAATVREQCPLPGVDPTDPSQSGYPIGRTPWRRPTTWVEIY
jgi:hypothetical protein